MAREPLTRERVVAAAVELADAEGIDRLSMRALAARLGVEAMSLYHHVATKAALLDAMVDVVFAEMHLPAVGAPWRAELRARSVSGRAVLLRHRWAVGLMDSRSAPGPHTLAHHDAVIGCLRAAGFDLPAIGHAVALLDAHLYGFLLQELALPFADEDELADLGAAIVDDATAAAFPHFAEFARDHAMQPGWSFAPEFEIGLDLVLGALAGLLPASAPQTPPAAGVAVLGVDGCRSGWVGALLVPGERRPRLLVEPTIDALVDAARALAPVEVVGIDIPIGLPDTSTRQADALARRALPGKASSVFSTLTRDAYAAPDRLSADAVNRVRAGQGVGAQAFALAPKIREVDAWVRAVPGVTVIEVHPEVTFATMAGAPLAPSKKSPEGREARLAALAAAGIDEPVPLPAGTRGVADDDVLDACAVAWTAARHARGETTCLPDPPEVFSDGLPATIVR